MIHIITMSSVVLAVGFVPYAFEILGRRRLRS